MGGCDNSEVLFSVWGGAGVEVGRGGRRELFYKRFSIEV